MGEIRKWTVMTTLSIKKKNEVYVTIQSEEPHVHHELSDYFSFEVPEAKFLKKNPRYKYWDGTIRLYSPGTGELYGGLMKHLQVWADERQYNIEYEKNDWYGDCLLYTSPSPRDRQKSRMPSSA